MIGSVNEVGFPATVPLPSRQTSAASGERLHDYINSHNLEAAVDKSLNLAQAELPSGSRTVLSLSNDSESEDAWLVMHLIVNAPRSELFDHYNRFMDAWTESIPPTMQHRIHITY